MKKLTAFDYEIYSHHKNNKLKEWWLENYDFIIIFSAIALALILMHMVVMQLLDIAMY